MSDTAALVTITVLKPEHRAEIHTVSLTQYELDCVQRERPGFTTAEWAHAALRADVLACIEAQRDTPEHIRECSADRYYNS